MKRLFFVLMSFFSLSVSADCGGLFFEKIIFCKKMDNNNTIAIYDSGSEGISVGLIQDKKEISSAKGLGQEVQNLQLKNDNAAYKLIQLKDQSIIVLRVKNERTSIVYFYALGDTLKPMPINEKEEIKKFLVTNYNAKVKLDDLSISVVERKYEAHYLIKRDEIVLSKFLRK